MAGRPCRPPEVAPLHGAAAPGGPREIHSTAVAAGNALGDLGNQGGELRERHGRQSCSAADARVERAGDQVDHGLVRHRAFDLVAVGRDRREIPGLGIARYLAHQPALADSGLAFDQDRVSGPGGEPRDESVSKTFDTSAYKWRGIASGRRYLVRRRWRSMRRRFSMSREAQGRSPSTGPASTRSRPRGAWLGPHRGNRAAPPQGWRAFRRVVQPVAVMDDARRPRSFGSRNRSN